jgi:hypothetical protein
MAWVDPLLGVARSVHGAGLQFNLHASETPPLRVQGAPGWHAAVEIRLET